MFLSAEDRILVERQVRRIVRHQLATEAMDIVEARQVSGISDQKLRALVTTHKYSDGDIDLIFHFSNKES